MKRQVFMMMEYSGQLNKRNISNSDVNLLAYNIIEVVEDSYFEMFGAMEFVYDLYEVISKKPKVIDKQINKLYNFINRNNKQEGQHDENDNDDESLPAIIEELESILNDSLDEVTAFDMIMDLKLVLQDSNATKLLQDVLYEKLVEYSKEVYICPKCFCELETEYWEEKREYGDTYCKEGFCELVCKGCGWGVGNES
jgi:hypothetical protein